MLEDASPHQTGTHITTTFIEAGLRDKIIPALYTPAPPLVLAGCITAQCEIITKYSIGIAMIFVIDLAIQSGFRLPDYLRRRQSCLVEVRVNTGCAFGACFFTPVRGLTLQQIARHSPHDLSWCIAVIKVTTDSPTIF